jgi:ankyrin repeat protein
VLLPLLKAIENGDVRQLQAVLAIDSEKAFLAAYDFEPPLCCAVRTGQTEEIFRELFCHDGADVNELNRQGQSPMHLLCAMPGRQQGSSEMTGSHVASFTGIVPSTLLFWDTEDMAEMSLRATESFSNHVRSNDSPELSPCHLDDSWQLRICALLMCAGANFDIQNYEDATPSETARRLGKIRLACFIEGYKVSQLIFIMHRALYTFSQQQDNGNPVGLIKEDILLLICAFLAPEGSDAMLSYIFAFLKKQEAVSRLVIDN